MAKAKAKEYFKNCASEILKNFKASFEQNEFHHLLPESFIIKTIQNIKEGIKLSLPQLTDEIVKSVCEVDKSKLNSENQKIVNKSGKGKRKIPKKATIILKNWLTEHFEDPYPCHAEKEKLANEAGITITQVRNWFTNARGRTWRHAVKAEKFNRQIEEKMMCDKEKDKLKLEFAPSSMNGAVSMQQFYLQLQLQQQMPPPNRKFSPSEIFKQTF